MPANAGPPPNSEHTEELAARIQALSEEFARGLKGQIGEIRRLWSNVVIGRASAIPGTDFTRIHEIAHALTGSGKSFGFPHISQAAAPLDSLFQLLTEKEAKLTGEEKEQIELLIDDLERAANIPGEPVILTITEDAETHQNQGDFFILLFGDFEFEPNTTASLQSMGYILARIREDTLSPTLQAGSPSVIIAKTEDVPDAVTWMSQRDLKGVIPLVAVGELGTFKERLDAVRNGAKEFLLQPLAPQDVFEQIAAIEDQQTAPPVRVVVCEDDITLAKFYRLTMEHAGLEVRMVDDPEDLLDTLAAFAADIIVLDLYLGDYNGLELAKMVRQFPSYTTVPILFLSTETRLSLHLQARHMGADDFLVKPLNPGQLVSAVTSRAHRYRELKKLTDRDSLTGLLNHSNILRALERELSAARRTKTVVSFAMVDIDHFKKVNDTYGHAVGDQVLIRVTHLIRNRLRRADHIGRYGGEEFAVVMPNTPIERARAIMDELREATKEVVHETSQGSFSVTFSSGLATSPPFQTPTELAQAADEALYRAKREGRDRVMVAEAPHKVG